MSTRMQDILAAALALPELERAALLRQLSESLPDDDEFWDKEFVQELDRRRAEIESGADPGIPAEQVHQEALRRLHGDDLPSAGVARVRKGD